MALIGASNSLGGISGSNAVARLLVVISGQSTGLEAAVAQSEGSLSGLSKNASSIGKTLTRSLTLPLLALGGLAVKTASDFETSFARVIGISTILDKRFNDLGLTSDTLRKTLIDMASDPAIVATPTELADALYFAGSAGLKASQALDVVRLSAQGASIGMGSAVDVSKVLIFALNNYASSGLTATKAMDTLTAAIQEGTAAPNELAIALGRLLPIAKLAGVSFETTVAAVAALTNLGVPTRVATTSLRALFSELLAPTQAATQRLNELGLSADQLRNVLAHGGLVAAMQLLLNATHGNLDALHDIIPQIRGFTAFAGLSTDQMKRYKSVFGGVTDAAGKFQKALKVIQATPGFKFQKALQQLQVAALNLGEQLLPVFVKIAGVIAAVAKSFSTLPRPIQTAAAAFIVFGAAIGPIFQLFGAITATTTKTLALGAAGQTVIPTWKALATSFVTAGIAAIVAFNGFQSLSHGSSSLVTVVTTLVGSFIALQLAIKGLQIITNLIGPTTALTSAFVSLGTGGIAVVAGALALLVTGIALFIGASKRGQVASAELQKELTDGAKSATAFRDTLDTVKNTAIRDELTAIGEKLKVLDQPTGGALASIVDVGGNVDKTIKALIDKMNALSLSTDGMSGKVRIALQTFQALRTGGATVAEALDKAGISSVDFQKELQRLGQEFPIGRSRLTDLTNSVLTSVAAFEAAAASSKDYQTSQKDNAIAALANQQSTDQLAKKLGVSTDYVSQKLGEAGQSAVGLQGDSLAAFKTFVTGGRQISVAAQEAADNISKAATQISGDLQNAFDPFGKLPKLAAPNIDKVITRIQKMGQVAATESANIVTLNKRGVPTSLIEKAIGAGPGFVQRLAGSTDKELRKIVTSYEKYLGETDDAVLAESAHQEKKGADMVQGFTTAILSSKQLPQAAAEQIVVKVTNAFAAGDLKPAALGMIQSFVAGLGHVKGLTQKEATAAVNAFANELIHGNVLNSHGKLMVDKVVAGIVSQTGLTKGAATQLVESVVGQLKQKEPVLSTAGLRLAGAAIHGLTQGAGGGEVAGSRLVKGLAAGILAEKQLAVNAAVSVALAAKAAMIAASKGSPEYFTYYLGKNIIHDLGRGMTEASHQLGATKPKVKLEGGFTAPNGNGRYPSKLDVALDVKLDRQKAGRELAYSANMGY